jgi:hypothetical protein
MGVHQLWRQEAQMDAFVESHLSQKKRKMGHPTNEWSTLFLLANLKR